MTTPSFSSPSLVPHQVPESARLFPFTSLYGWGAHDVRPAHYPLSDPVAGRALRLGGGPKGVAVP